VCLLNSFIPVYVFLVCSLLFFSTWCGRKSICDLVWLVVFLVLICMQDHFLIHFFPRICWFCPLFVCILFFHQFFRLAVSASRGSLFFGCREWSFCVFTYSSFSDLRRPQIDFYFFCRRICQVKEVVLETIVGDSEVPIAILDQNLDLCMATHVAV